MAVFETALHWPCGLDDVVWYTFTEPAEHPERLSEMKGVRWVRTHDLTWKDGKRVARQEVASNARLPLFLRQMIGDKAVGWRQTSAWDPGNREIKVTVRPHILSGVVAIHSHITLAPQDDGVRQNLRIEALCEMPVVGPLLERLIVDGAADSLVEHYQGHIRRLSAGAGTARRA